MEYTLITLRRILGVTQETLAKRMGIGQQRVSCIERQELRHSKVETLVRLVNGLGGTLVIVAEFPDGTIELCRVAPKVGHEVEP